MFKTFMKNGNNLIRNCCHSACQLAYYVTYCACAVSDLCLVLVKCLPNSRKLHVGDIGYQNQQTSCYYSSLKGLCYYRHYMCEVIKSIRELIYEQL